MAAGEVKEELKVYLPWDVIDAGKGISMDIGGSAIKILYLHKDDWKEPSQRKESEKGCLRLVNFSREEMKEAFAYTNKNVHILRERSEETVKICSTGLGGSQFYKQIREAFNIDNKNIAEADCFAQSLVYLVKHIPRKELLVEIYEPAFEHTRKHVDRYHKMMSKMKSVSTWEKEENEDEAAPTVQYPVGYQSDQDRPLAEEQGIFPCMLFACGSAFGGIQVKEDGTYSLGTVSNRGGKTFCGLGSLLTGCQTFDELMALCEKGSANKVALTNIHVTENLNTEDEDSVYTAAKDQDMDETILYYFGQAVGQNKDKFKKEDMARCLLEMTIQDLVQVAQSTCINRKLKNIFFCGSFVCHPLVRQLITREWLYRDVQLAMFMADSDSKEQIGFHFLHHGSHLGALGAYLNSKSAAESTSQEQSDTTK